MKKLYAQSVIDLHTTFFNFVKDGNYAPIELTILKRMLLNCRC